MNTFIGSVVALATAGSLSGCAQTPPMQHGMMIGQTPMMMGQMPMMMGQMPMMMGRPGAGPDADKMMAMCMEHMQAMSGPQGGVAPPQTPAR